MNKGRSQTFTFMMEMIIVIFFFALSSMICVSFLSSSKHKMDDGKYLQASMNEANNMIVIMQHEKDKSIEELFDVKKEKDYYVYKGMQIRIENNQYVKKGTIKISDEIIVPFVIGEKDEG